MAGPEMATDSPVALVLRAILNLKSTSNTDTVTPQIRVLSYRKEFDEIWGLGTHRQKGILQQLLILGEQPPLFRGEMNLVVVWDGVPEASDISRPESIAIGQNSANQKSEQPNKGRQPAINVSDHLTVFDWTVAVCCAASQRQTSQRQKGNDSLPKLRLFILDLAPPQHSSAFASQTFPDFLPRLPWVRVYRPVARYADQFRLAVAALPPDVESEMPGPNQGMLGLMYGPNTLDIGALLDDLGVGASAHGKFAWLDEDERLTETAALLRELWSSQLTKAENRHSIANLVGPAILQRALEPATPEDDPSDDRGTPLVGALHLLMKALGLVPAKDGTDKAPWIPRQRWEDLVDCFVLVDDMADHGWRRFLARALDISDDKHLVCCATPDASGFGSDGMRSIVDLLVERNIAEEHTGQQPEKLRVNKHLSLSGHHDREVLFLDLRLFSNRDSDKETAFFARLLELARQVQDGTQGLPWDGFLEDEIQAIQKCITNREVEDNDYYIALTMLPRLIALVDPTLPIVLFSSTGQKHVVDALAPYGNIVLDFDKPRFLGHSIDTVFADTKARFRRAIAGALTLSRGRDLCISLRKAREDAASLQPKPTTTATPAKSITVPYFEVYVEESGSPGDPNGFRIGGFIVEYPDRQSADAFFQEMSKEGFVWGWHSDDPWESMPVHRLKKYSETNKDLVAPALEKLAVLAGSQGLSITMFSLGSTQAHLPRAIATWAGPDALYRSLLRDALEVILFEWLPQWNSQAAAKVAIHIGTRMLAMPASTELLRVARDFGLEVMIEHRNDKGRHDIRMVQVNERQLVQEKEKVRQAMQALPLNDVAFAMHWKNLRCFFKADRQAMAVMQPLAPRAVHKLLAYSVTFDHIHPIVSEVYAERPSCRTVPEIVAAKGVRLKYYNMSLDITPHQLPRQIHYATDWALGDLSAVPKQWKQRGFGEERDEQFTHLLRACRLAESGQHVDAIVEWSGAASRRSGMMWAYAAERVARSLDCIDGSAFVELCGTVDRVRRQSRAAHRTANKSATAATHVDADIIADPSGGGRIWAKQCDGAYAGQVGGTFSDGQAPQVGERWLLQIIQFDDVTKRALFRAIKRQ